jgi:type II secretory pathway component PulF
MDDGLPIGSWMTSDWVEFLALVGAIVLVAIGGLIWTFFLRKRKRRRRRKSHHRHERRLPNLPLAQSGGLPPIRQKEKPSVRQMPTAQP